MYSNPFGTTIGHRFKHGGCRSNMSNILSFYVQKSGQRDDVIRVFSVEDAPDMFRVKYIPNDGNNSYTFYYNKKRVENYVETIVHPLSSDVEPFSYFQVASVISPSVIYNIADLASCDVRREIMELIHLTLEAYPVKNERE